LIAKYYHKLLKLKKIITVLIIITFSPPNLVYGDNDLEKSYKKFVKETNKIRKQLSSLPTGDSKESKIFDDAIKEVDQVTKFAQENFNPNNFEITEKTLNYLDRSLSDINKSLPKGISNDLSVVDMNNLEDKELEQIFQTSEAIKATKKEKLTSLVKDMTIIEKKGLNLFVVSKNINDLGLKTVNFEDIAKTVVDEPSLKSEVLDAAKRVISPEEFEKQMEVIVEAEKLGIAESTANVLKAAKDAGFTKDVMPTLETMRGNFFDAEAHNEAMKEMADEIQSGGLGEGTGAAEAAASYTEQDRADQKAQSEADCTGSCAGDTESGQ